jgi:hypothetical protein
MSDKIIETLVSATIIGVVVAVVSIGSIRTEMKFLNKTVDRIANQQDQHLQDHPKAKYHPERKGKKYKIGGTNEEITVPDNNNLLYRGDGMCRRDKVRTLRSI